MSTVNLSQIPEPVPEPAPGLDVNPIAAAINPPAAPLPAEPPADPQPAAPEVVAVPVPQPEPVTVTVADPALSEEESLKAKLAQLEIEEGELKASVENLTKAIETMEASIAREKANRDGDLSELVTIAAEIEKINARLAEIAAEREAAEAKRLAEEAAKLPPVPVEDNTPKLEIGQKCLRPTSDPQVFELWDRNLIGTRKELVRLVP